MKQGPGSPNLHSPADSFSPFSNLPLPPPHLAYVDGVPTWCAAHLDLDALHEALELLPDVPRALHAAVLDEVLVAPLGREIRVRPLQETRKLLLL
jgi:hypothetical protein